jgi:glycerol-3-phosphate dehydrogenase
MKLRSTNLRKLGEGTYDVLIVGGGINGAVGAAALAAKGARVALIDRGDFAGGTSQQSSNLAWGGIKYLESYEFGLVRKLCQSRNTLMRSYPSTVQEIRFFTTHAKGFRHGLWKLVLGAWLYWFMGSFFTRTPRRLSRGAIEREEPIINLEGADGGFEYSDAYLHDNDARFVFGFIQSALRYGGIVANYVEATSAARAADGAWTVQAKDVVGGGTFAIRAKVLLNAGGPWADALNRTAGVTTEHRHVFSKGIHLIVNRLTPSRRVLTFFADDGRLFFVIPMGPKTCIGTTDTWVDRPEVTVTPEDRRFVLENVNKRLRLANPLTEADVIAERCGVRPLVVKGPPKTNGDGRDWMHLSRKHAIEMKRENASISVFGGKLTDCLNVGEEICDAVVELGVPLPFPKKVWFGEPGPDAKAEFLHRANLMGLDAHTHPTASEPLSQRLWRRYGVEAFGMLEEIRADPTSAELLIESAEYLRCELAYTARAEMVTRLEDFLRRRSKIALVVRREQLEKAAGLREACRILFGDEADAKLEEYFRNLGTSQQAA